MSDLDATNYNRNFLFWTRNILQRGAGAGRRRIRATSSGTARSSRRTGRARARRRPASTTRSRGPTPRRLRTTAASAPATRSATPSRCPARSGRRRVTARRRRRTCPRRSCRPARAAATQLNGINSAPDFNFGTADTSTPFPGGTPVGFGWIFGAQAVDVEDQEDWAQIDADFALDGGAFTGLQFGVRYSNHRATRSGSSARARSSRGASDPANYPDDVPELPVRLQQLRRIVPDECLVLDARAARGLQQCRQRQPRSGGAARLDRPVPGRGEELGCLRAGGFRRLQLERQHRRALRAGPRKTS